MARLSLTPRFSGVIVRCRCGWNRFSGLPHFGSDRVALKTAEAGVNESGSAGYICPYTSRPESPGKLQTGRILSHTPKPHVSTAASSPLRAFQRLRAA